MSEIRRRRQLQQVAQDMGPTLMPQGMPGEGLPQAVPGVPAGMPAEEQMPSTRPMRTAEEEDAFNLGARMGAQSIAAAAGATQAEEHAPMGMTRERLIEAERKLMEYKKGKASVDRRIINAQQWWKLRNWEMIEAERGTKGATRRKSATAWLWNCIVGKHADAMDSYPEPVILPRMQEDKAQAQMLSDIIPAVLQINHFEDTYDSAQWQKMQEGTATYHVGWDKTKLGGIGDINIENISLLNLFWEPGCEDIEDSENLFYVQIVDCKRMEQQYPQLEGKLKSAYLKPNEYRKDDSVTMDGKCVVVDWYYHIWNGNRKILHYCQFVGEEVIYSTEDAGQVNGLYDDGEYPFVLDPLYPVHGSPAGYGYIDIGRDVQSDIDTINQAMVQNAIVTSTPRYFIQSDGAINEEEFADWSKPFVHTGGGLGDNSIRPVVANGIQGSALSMLERKIDELKFVTGNQDVNNGGTPSGVTAASAIAALQEHSGRASKDATRGAYRAFSKIVNKVIERIRQFYEIPRMFRILGPGGQEEFVAYNNAQLQDQQLMGGLGMEDGMRHPVFDIDVRSQRETSYSKMSQNELAVQFMQMGVFNPQLTDQTLMMLDMMEFKGKEEIEQKVRDMGTVQDALMKVGSIALELANRFAPGIAVQLAPILQGIGMDAGAVPQGGGEMPTLDIPEGEGNEPTRMKKAREQANNSTRPT